MAREYAQIKLALWADDDVRALSPQAQHLYLVLLTAPSMSHCGVADWRPKRIAALAKGWTVEQVEEAAAELIEAMFIVVDEATEEVLIRSFVRHDGLMKQPKMATAMASAHAAVASSVLRGVIVHELRRLREDFPDLHGWGSVKASELLGKGSVNPSGYPLGKGSVKGSGKGKPTPSGEGSGKGCPTPAPTPAPTTNTVEDPAPAGAGAAAPKPEDYSPEFEAAWAAYFRRGAKRKAWAEWKRAIKRADPATIVEAIPRYLAANRDPRYRLHFERYLSGDVWESVPGGPGGEVLPPHLHRDRKTGRLVER